jgi:hypothetical protein
MRKSKQSLETKPASGAKKPLKPTSPAAAPAAPKRTIQPKPRTSSKQEQVLGMLRRPEGATIAAMMKATGWQQHSVRGFLAGVVRKRLKLALSSTKIDGERIYKVAKPARGSNSRQDRRKPA